MLVHYGCSLSCLSITTCSVLMALLGFLCLLKHNSIGLEIAPTIRAGSKCLQTTYGVHVD